MFKKLRIALTAVCTLGTVLVLTGMAAVSLRYPQQELTRQAEESFGDNLSAIFHYLQGRSTIEHVWMAQTEASAGVYISIEDAGRPLQYTAMNANREQLAALARQTALEEYGFDSAKVPAGTLQPVWVRFTLRRDGESYRAAVCAAPVSGGWVGVTVLKSTAREDAQMLRLRLTFAGAGGAAALLLLLFAWVFTGRAIRPIEENRRKQAEFISAASHELRSPLAVMQASAGAMQTAPLEQARRFARNIEGECQRLSGLAGDLLALAGSDSHRWSILREEAEPETMLLCVGERFEPLAREKGLSISVQLPQTTLPRCGCDPQRVQQLLSILVDNAVSYTSPGGTIVLRAERGRRWVRFSVSDNGPGIPDEQKKLIFDRFYRGDASRTNREHYGLGLSIAHEIAVLHKGTLTVRDSPEGGAEFVLALPFIR